MSDSQGTSIEIRRAWRYNGEDEAIVHIELGSGNETLKVNLKSSRNPRMFEFITKHATVTTEARPAKEPKEVD